jgi:dephospho-CoA kinase
LTGGIASGKTTIANRFATLGASVVDTDIGARRVVEPGEPGLVEIVQAFGSAVLSADGSLNRAALRRLIFRDATARQRLGDLLHPRIEAWALAEVARATGPYCLLVVPLLVESGRLLPHVRRVLVVDVPEAVQIERLCARDGVSEQDARLALTAQATRAQRLAAADDVIDNSAPPARIEQRVVELHACYLACAQAGGRD